MHTSLPAWLALSAALFPTTTAFYPYSYGDDSTSSSSPDSRLRRTPQPSNDHANARSITLPIRRVPALASRDNAYNIVNSKDPSQENSVAIDQDGADLSYMVAVRFGDSTEEYHLLLDSAASNTWVMGQECTSTACKTHNTFGTGDSSTLKTQDTPFNVTYGTGSVSGTLATDTLHIGSLTPSLTFGLATTVSKEFRSYPMDGILGIGRGVATQGSIDAPQVMDVLTTSNLIGSKIYGIHLSRNKEGLLDGELNLGAVNKDRFSGDINYIAAVDTSTGFWEIPISDAGVDGSKFGLTGRSAIIDTGTSFILMPAADALSLHSQIRGFKQDGETFSVPCTTTAKVTFHFNNKGYDISSADWVGGELPNSGGQCRSNIIGRQTFGASQWLVGDVFLKNVYSVFDFDAKKVGFGVKSAQAQDLPTATGTGTSITSESPVPGESGSPATTTGIPTGTSTDTTIVGTASPAASQTGTGSGSGPASSNPSAAAETQPQGQKGQGAAAGRASAPLYTVVGVIMVLSLCI